MMLYGLKIKIPSPLAISWSWTSCSAPHFHCISAVNHTASQRKDSKTEDHSNFTPSPFPNSEFPNPFRIRLPGFLMNSNQLQSSVFQSFQFSNNNKRKKQEKSTTAHMRIHTGSSSKSPKSSTFMQSSPVIAG